MIRIVIGTEASQLVPQKVLRHSILANTRSAVDIHVLTQQEARIGGTNFGFVRFHVPGHFGFDGRAIYLDADQLVLADIDALWQALDDDHDVALVQQAEGYFGDKPVEQMNQTSVMVLDCGRLRDWDCPRLFETVVPNRATPQRGQIRYREFMALDWMAGERVQPIDPAWNHFNVLRPDTRLVHFSHVRSQPWKNPDHPLAGYWKGWLFDAIGAGRLSTEELTAEIAAGHIHAAFSDIASSKSRAEAEKSSVAQDGWLTVVINDLGLPKTQRHLLAKAIRDGHRVGTDIEWVSEMSVEPPGHWHVAGDVGRTLAAKIGALAAGKRAGRTLYLDGNCIVRSDLSELLDREFDAPVVTDGAGTLNSVRCFLIDHDRMSRSPAVVDGLTETAYDDVAACRLVADDLPGEWIPAPAGRGDAPRLIACHRYEDRPWLVASAAAAGIWHQQLADALTSGAIDRETIEADLSQGLMRPSVLFGLQLGDQRGDVACIDDDFVFPDFRLNAAQERLVQSSRFAAPRKVARRKHRKHASRRTLNAFEYLVKSEIRRVLSFSRMLLSVLSIAMRLSWEDPGLLARKIRKRLFDR